MNAPTIVRPAKATITLRNPEFSPLSDAQIRAFAPSVYQDQPRNTCSSRYQFVQTSELVDAMRGHGLQPTEVAVYQRRNPEWRPYAMHLIRFTLDGSRAGLKKAGDVAPQIVLRNSHDGSSPLELYGGLFRMVCSNGLIVSESSTVAPLRVKHSAFPVLEAMFGVEQLVLQNRQVFEHVDAMRGRVLTEKEQIALALRALELREGAKGVIAPEAVLHARRTEDNGADLWRVYNRIQENLIRGGLEGKNAAGVVTRTQGVNAIQSQLALNAGLWSLAMHAISKASGSAAAAVHSAAPAKVQAIQAIAQAALPAPAAARPAPSPMISMAAALTGLPQ